MSSLDKCAYTVTKGGRVVNNSSIGSFSDYFGLCQHSA